MLMWPSATLAQDHLIGDCRNAVAQPATRAFCELAAHAAETLEARVGIAAAAGNPVPGTASTFGIKLGSIPRMSIGGRFTLTSIELPPIESIVSTTADGLLPSLSLDGSVGIYSGLTPAPTVGGFLSLDLVGSFGAVWLPDSDGFNGDSPLHGGIGARVGITRESFTVPGISLSLLYRRFGEVTYGDIDLGVTDAFLRVDGHSAWSLRAAVGKRVSAIGLTGGLGYDRHRADVLLRVANPGGATIQSTENGLSTGRISAFANASFTLLILSAVGELGWQQGGDAPSVVGGDAVGNGAWFGSLAIRLAI